MQSRVAPPPTPQLPPSEVAVKYPSAISAIISLSVDNDSVSRRVLGRCVDPVTGAQYHMDSNPPPDDQAIKARLQRPSDSPALGATLQTQLISFEESISEVHSWFERFGTLRLIDAGGKIEVVASDVTTVVKNVVAAKDEQRRDNDQEAERKRRSEQLAAENLSKVSKEARNLVETDVEVLATAGSVARTDAETSNGGASKRDRSSAKAKEKEKDEPKSPNRADASASAGVPTTGHASHDPSAVPAQDASAALPRGDAIDEERSFATFLDKPLAVQLAEKWIGLETHYTNNFKRLFRLLRSERWASLDHFAKLRGDFLKFLRRPDTKSSIVEAFQEEYNRVDADLRNDVEVKDELHLRIDELSDKLWGISEQRKNEALEQLALIHRDGFVANHCEAIVIHTALMAQLELDRYLSSLNLARDFLAVWGGEPASEPFALCTVPVAEIISSTSPTAEHVESSKESKEKNKSVANNKGGSKPENAVLGFSRVKETAMRRMQALLQFVRGTCIVYDLVRLSVLTLHM